MAFQEEESAAEALPPPPAETKPENAPVRESAQVAVTETPKPAESRTVTLAVAPAAAPPPPPKPAPVRAAKIDKPTERPAAKPQARSGWVIQVGAFQAEEEAKQRLSKVRSKASKMLDGADPFTETIDKGGTTYYRARFAGLDKEKAEAACKYLKRNDVECVTTKY
jgi:D-alanyl-D-alanine carboxypeptidase